MPPLPDQMLSRRERKKRETRKRILDAAMHLMSDRPYDEVRIEDICSAADVANATFFLHFENKSALVLAFNEEVASKISDELMGDAQSASEQLRKLLEVYLREWGAHRHLMRQIVLEFVSQSNAAASFNEVSPGLQELVGKAIHRGQNSGEFLSTIPPETAALGLIAAWNAMAVSWARSGDTKGAADAHWQILDVFVSGLKTCDRLSRQ